MEDKNKKRPLNKKKILIKEEQKFSSLFNNNKGEISQKEYDHRKKNCFFFMRSPVSNQIILEIKPDSKKKKKKKKKQRTYFHLQFKSETKNNNIKPVHHNFNQEEKTTYINLQPRKTWLNCKKIYNKCLKDYNPDLFPKHKRFYNGIYKESIIEESNSKSNPKNYIEDLKILDRPSIYLNKDRGTRNKTLKLKLSKSVFLSKNLNKNRILNKYENNFIRYMNKTIDSNFVNKGISGILKDINLEDMKDLKEYKFGKDKNMKVNMKKRRINLSLKFERKRLSLLNIQLPKLKTAKEMGVNLDFEYKINSYFEFGNKNSKIENEENEDLEIVAEKGNFRIKELYTKKETLENNKEIQSDFNFFCLKHIFRLEQFHIFGLICGKGNEAQKCSRILKKIFIDYFSNENNYIDSEILEKIQFDKKIDYILFILTTNRFQFLKNMFNSLESELKNKGVDIENTGVTFSLILFVKDKVISAKIGDIHPYFIYNILSEDSNQNLILRNPHLQHNLNNILEQDRLEENKCEIIINKNNLGKKEYNIEYKSDEEIQNYLNNDKIKCTRMIGYLKLRKIGIINQPEIESFSMYLEKGKIEKLGTKRENGNLHVSDSDFSELINKKGIDFTKVILKFVIIGNDELFDIMKNSYYIKEIYEAMVKDENRHKNKNNIKFFFNIKNTLRKLVYESVEINKKYNTNNLKDLALALVTLVES
jgi:serine/threonine protein phosphatase PrpC